MLLAAAVTSSTQAEAFTTASARSPGCHERMTLAAIQAAGWPDGAQAPAPDERSRLIAEDSFFLLPEALRDGWTVALIEGVRHNDVHSHSLLDLVDLAIEAAEPESQREHCLRAPGDDGPGGDAAALAACRAYILSEVARAIGDGDVVNVAATETVEVTLVFRGSVELPLSRYALRMGKALHAFQDGFSHTFRTPDGQRVTHVLNYVDFVEATYDEARDGHEHLSHLDRCSDGLDAQSRRIGNATRASAELLAAVADGTGGREGRLDRARQVLERWLSHEPGCTVANGYCDASELREPEPGGCAVSGDGSAPWWLLAIAAILYLRRARDAQRSAAGLFLIVAASPASADARQPDDPPPSEPSLAKPTPLTPAKASDGEQPKTRPADALPINRGFGVHLGIAGSLDQASFAVSGGLRLDLLHWFAIGLDAEFNPWFSIEGERAAPGTTNVYLPLIFTWASVGPIELRSTLLGGVSILNFDLVGAEDGTVGPFVGTTPIGVALRLARPVRLIMDPGGLYVSVPQTRGIPIVYRQHRVSFGLQITP